MSRREAEYEALISDVIAAPDDDVPRLLMADWFDDAGEYDRAEFVRLQLQMEKTPKTIRLDTTWDQYGGVQFGDFEETNPEYQKLCRRESELIDGSLMTWNALPSWVEEWHWRRGFVERVKCRLSDWMDHGRDAVRRHPLRRLEASDKRTIHAGPTFGWWGWSDGRIDNGEMVLPLAVWRLLKRNTLEPGQYKWFDSREEADAALSAAMLAYARGGPFMSGSKGVVEMGEEVYPIKEWRLS